MHAGNLKPTQLEELMGTVSDEFDRKALVEKEEAYTKLESQDMIRNAEEILESYRLRKVLAGEWTEEDSRHLLKQ